MKSIPASRWLQTDYYSTLVLIDQVSAHPKLQFSGQVRIVLNMKLLLRKNIKRTTVDAHFVMSLGEKVNKYKCQVSNVYTEVGVGITER